MGSPFTILQGKDTGKQPLFLVTIKSADGDTTYLTSATYYGGTGLTYNGNNYLPRILQNDIDAIQATGPQGYTGVPSFKLTIADADKFIWTNHCMPHGMGGAQVTLVVVLWDLINNQYSTDALSWSFIASNPSHEYAKGQTLIQVMSSINYARVKVPSAPISTNCIWDMPVHLVDRQNGFFNFISNFFQCPYSPDVPGGVGNLKAKGSMGGISGSALSTTFTYSNISGSVPSTPFQATCGLEEFLVTNVAGSTWTVQRAYWNSTLQGHGGGSIVSIPYDDCELIRSSPGPSVGCMARLGAANDTSISIDGNLLHDLAGNYTGEFSGNSWLAPSQFTGNNYLSGQKTLGFNSQNSNIIGTYYNFVYGTQWVNGAVLAPAGDPNSLRSEVVVCVATQPGINVLKVVVNGVELPQNGSDVLFTWRYLTYPRRGDSHWPGGSGNFFPAGQEGATFRGGRQGTINRDNIYNIRGVPGPDPHGSLPPIEVVVPSQVGSVQSVQILVTGPPVLHVLPISFAAASGGNITITFTAGTNNQYCTVIGQTVYVVNQFTGNGVGFVGSFTSTSVTLTGTTASGSGAGGALFYYAGPELMDNGFSISNNIAGPACNLVWARLDLMTWGNLDLTKIDAQSWYNAATIAANNVTYTAADGSTRTHAQFKASFGLDGKSPKVLASVLTGLDNGGNLIVGPNSTNGQIQCYVKQTLADQQPSTVPGSNYNTAVPSLTANDTFANGFYAMVFNETNIELGSFRVITTTLQETPNTFSASLQDEYNGYQIDSLKDVDPVAYAFSGNQEVDVPVPITGPPNFDQLTRIGNVKIAEALYGNPRNDPGGTLYFEFSTNITCIGLASRIGYICGLTWTGLGIGTSLPQAVRIVSMKPDTDGEHWLIRCSWHQDIWYTYIYGQDPQQFQSNPLLNPPLRPPYPWRPGQQVSSALFSSFALPLNQTFGLSVDTTQYPAQLTLNGEVPVNQQPDTKPPLIPLQASTQNTGGLMNPGSYFVAVSSNGQIGPVSKVFATVLIPVGTTTNTVTISGIQWPSGAAAAPAIYIGDNSLDMGYLGTSAGGNWVGSAPDANGNPTTIVIETDFGLLGLPDTLASNITVIQQGIAHGGVWADVVTARTGGAHPSITIGDANFDVDQWAGGIISIYFQDGSVIQQSTSRNVVSNTPNVLTLDHTPTPDIGDVVVMRAIADSWDDNHIGCTGFKNWYSPAGLDVTGMEIGRQIMIIAGTGANTTPKTIIGNTDVAFGIAGTWDITPDATSIFIVLYPAQTTTPGGPISNDGSTAMPAKGINVATVPAATVIAQSMLITAVIADSNGNYAPLQYQPWREIYIPDQSSSISSTTIIERY